MIIYTPDSCVSSNIKKLNHKNCHRKKQAQPAFPAIFLENACPSNPVCIVKSGEPYYGSFRVLLVRCVIGQTEDVHKRIIPYVLARVAL
jgi:hypothetical protein